MTRPANLMAIGLGLGLAVTAGSEVAQAVQAGATAKREAAVRCVIDKCVPGQRMLVASCPRACIAAANKTARATKALPIGAFDAFVVEENTRREGLKRGEDDLATSIENIKICVKTRAEIEQECRAQGKDACKEFAIASERSCAEKELELKLAGVRHDLHRQITERQRLHDRLMSILDAAGAK